MSTLPTFAQIPPGLPRRQSIPLGLYDGGVLCWDPDIEPHMLLTGRTRTGKTSLVRTVVKGLSERGAEIVLIDPKRSALVDVAALPGVLGRATSRDLDDVAHKIGWVERRMYERYNALEAGHSADSFSRLVLVIDEGRLLYEITKTHWNTVVKPREVARLKALKDSRRPVGSEHPCMEQIRSILRLGGEAKVSVVLISQQADASWLSTEARQNLGMRVALGNMDDEGLGMMFGRRTRLEPLPQGEDGMPIKGRAYAATVGQQPIEIQAFWTPEIPRTGPSPRDLPTQPIPVQRPRQGLLQRLGVVR